VEPSGVGLVAWLPAEASCGRNSVLIEASITSL
jgi:hypothetical protein